MHMQIMHCFTPNVRWLPLSFWCLVAFWRRGATTDTRAWSTKWWRTPRRSATPLPTFFARPTTRRSARAKSLLFTGHSPSESTGEKCKKMSREPGRRSASLIFSCNACTCGLHTLHCLVSSLHCRFNPRPPPFLRCRILNRYKNDIEFKQAVIYWVFGPCQRMFLSVYLQLGCVQWRVQ